MRVHVAIYCPLLAALLLGRCAPALARLLPPATATRVLTAVAASGAAATLVSLAVLASTLAGDVPALAGLAGARPVALASSDPVPGPVAVGAATALVLVLADALRVVLTRLRALAAARALARTLGGGAGSLVVVDDDVDAMALPVGGGRILASRARLAELPPDERRALLLHESAHLRHRHHLYRLVTDLAAALAPQQRPVRAAVVYATERWADEAAAAELGDRAVVARVLARSGIRSTGAARRWDALAMAGRRSSVVPRVRALLAPAPRQRPGMVVAAAALVAFAAITALHAQHDGDAWFDAASTSHAGAPGAHRSFPSASRAPVRAPV